MTGFEPGSSGVESDHAVNCATTTALSQHSLLTIYLLFRKDENKKRPVTAQLKMRPNSKKIFVISPS